MSDAFRETTASHQSMLAQLRPPGMPAARPTYQAARRDRAFTLVELLVVLTIIMFLFGFLSEMVGIARRGSARTQTLSIMHKVDTALRSFKSDFKVYPYAWSTSTQNAYPDLAAGQPWSNRLYYQLGTTITDANRQHVQADMDYAAAQYNYDCSYWNPDTAGSENTPLASIHTFRCNRNDGMSNHDQWNSAEGDPVPVSVSLNKNTNTYYFNYENGLATCVLLNRMAQERARLLILAGDVGATGVKMATVPEPPSPYQHDGRDLSGILLIPPGSQQSAQEPGWAMDYLEGEIEKQYIGGENILDAYHHPLIYLYHVLPGVRSSQASPVRSPTGVWDPQDYGLTTIGRKTLSSSDLPDLTPTATAPGGGLPDPTNLMHSDITAYAAPGYENEFELWSAGPDGQFAYMRDAAPNRDNIPCDNYNHVAP